MVSAVTRCEGRPILDSLVGGTGFMLAGYFRMVANSSLGPGQLRTLRGISVWPPFLVAGLGCAAGIIVFKLLVGLAGIVSRMRKAIR